MTRPTSKDVAQRAGVSRTTVSYVINGKSGGGVRISEATRERVLSAVKELGYTPNAAAASLRTRRSNLIAVMIPHIESQFHPLFASVLQEEIEESNLDVMVYSARDIPRREKQFIAKLLSRRVDGVFIHSYNLAKADIDPLVAAGVGVVVAGPSPAHPYADNIVFDERASVSALVQQMAQKGHRRIGHISCPTRTWAGNERLLGYRDGLREAGILFDESLVAEADFYKEETAQTAMARLLDVRKPPTAVFASSDLLATTAILYCQDKGMHVPDDIAVAGIDGLPVAEMTRPKLTTIRKDYALLGKAAAKLLLERVRARGPMPAREHRLQCEIVHRKSL